MDGTPPLTPNEFAAIGDVVYRRVAIRIPTGKEELVRGRLAKRLRHYQVHSFGDYLSLVMKQSSQEELWVMIDLLTTNETSFFRERAHFEFLKRTAIPAWQARREEVRIWSAASSTGQEAYSVAMLVKETAPQLKVSILATDLSARVLEVAKKGVYDRELTAQVPDSTRKRFFTVSGDLATIAPEIRSMVTFARLNLMSEWPMKRPFQLILCRNVMIYFDNAVRQQLVNRFWPVIEEDGYLFPGHSEPFNAIEHPFTYVQPAVYQKRTARASVRPPSGEP